MHVSIYLLVLTLYSLLRWLLAVYRPFDVRLT